MIYRLDRAGSGREIEVPGDQIANDVLSPRAATIVFILQGGRGAECVQKLSLVMSPTCHEISNGHLRRKQNPWL